MTDMTRLRAAVDALAACPDAGVVADLLRARGCRGYRFNPCQCPVAAYFQEVGGDPNATAGAARVFAAGFPGGWRMTDAVRQFVRAFDSRAYADLSAA